MTSKSWCYVVAWDVVAVTGDHFVAVTIDQSHHVGALQKNEISKARSPRWNAKITLPPNEFYIMTILCQYHASTSVLISFTWL